MAINNFTEIVIDGSGTLTVQGQTVDANGKVSGEPGTQIVIAVISCDPAEGKRCDPEVTSDDAGSWLGRAPAGTHDFADQDVVFAIGEMSVPPSEDVTVWCGKFRIGDETPLASSETTALP